MAISHWQHFFPHWSTRIASSKFLDAYLNFSSMTDEDLQFAQYVEKFPKSELHVHAEACTWASFYHEENLRLKLFEDSQMPAQRLPFHQFNDFLAAWIDNLKFADHESFYERLALAVAKRQSDCRILYTELHLSPLDTSVLRERFGKDDRRIILKPIENIMNFLKGLRRAEDLFPDLKLKVIIDSVSLSEKEDLEHLFEVLKAICEHPLALDSNRESFVVGVGLGGVENPAGIAKHLDFFSQCRALGLKVDIHSGEQLGLDQVDVQTARDLVQPDRISHGFQCLESGLRFSRHTAMCPTSNILTGSFLSDLSKHPIAKLWAEGRDISVNTDDPLLFGTTLTLEYVALRKALGLGEDFFKKTQDNAAHAKLNFGPRVPT